MLQTGIFTIMQKATNVPNPLYILAIISKLYIHFLRQPFYKNRHAWWSGYLNRPPALNYAGAGVGCIGGEFVGFRSAFSKGEIKAAKAGIRYLPPASVWRENREPSLRNQPSQEQCAIEQKPKMTQFSNFFLKQETCLQSSLHGLSVKEFQICDDDKFLLAFNGGWRNSFRCVGSLAYVEAF